MPYNQQLKASPFYQNQSKIKTILDFIAVQQYLNMGSKQSIHIETPEFNPNEWEYIPDTNSEDQDIIQDQYGLKRTLMNRSTGQKIDEYQFIWPSQQEYLYYLKSFNWRHKQANVVNTRFIVEKNKEQICSHSYMARVYIQHIKIRLSQINDIPYPDNLYVLMQALEGYNKIYQHSKYFDIQENQICVDDRGNIKIWVNGDLSINYPNNEGSIDYRQKGQEDMADLLVNLIADNTDPETEPNPNFREYYNQRKGPKGKRFEEVRVFVLSYARTNNIEIPARFEAILNMDKEEEEDLQSFDQNGEEYQGRRGDWQKPYPNQNRYDGGYNRFNHHSSAAPSTDQIPLKSANGYSQLSHQQAPYLNQSPTFYPIQHQGSYPTAINYSHPQQAAPVYYIPQYARIEYPISNSIPFQSSQTYQQNRPMIRIPYNPQQTIIQPTNIPFKTFQNANYQQPNQKVQLPQHNSEHEHSSANHHVDIPHLNQDFDVMEIDDEDQTPEQFYQQQQRRRHQRNGSATKEINKKTNSQTDDMVARSLPLRSGYPSSNNSQQLVNMGQNDRAIYSHISPKDQGHVNVDGFGLSNPQIIMKQSGHSQNQPIARAMSTKKSKIEGKAIKYFYSLDQQLQIDPQIAADLQRYLS